MTPKDLKDYLNQVLDPTEIGTYIYPNQATGQAIGVSNTPNDVTVTGLEFIIPNFPHVVTGLRSSCQTHNDERWHLMIINHDMDNKSLFYTVLDKLRRSFHRYNVTDIPPTDPRTTVQRARFTIIHSEGYQNLNYL